MVCRVLGRTVNEAPAVQRSVPTPIHEHAAFSVMVKPVGAACNMDCTYCYYLHKQALLGQPRHPRMEPGLLEEHIRQTLESQPGPEVVFHWQGGEPTMAGLDFYRHAVALQQRHRRPGQQIGNNLQTNGTLLDDEWAAFLAENGFLVGLSLDGPREINDRHRRSLGHASVFDRVAKAARRLHRHEVPFSVLCVVNRDNARRPLEVYRFLSREVRPRMLQFIPGYEPVDFRTAAPGFGELATAPSSGSPRARPGAPDSVVTPWSVDPVDWGRFLCAVWDEWLAHDYGRVFVDLFEDALSVALGCGSQRCVSAARCGRGLALEADGSLYSCDHYVYPQYRLGQIAHAHQAELANSPRQRAFGDAKSESLPRTCLACAHLALCGGDCPKSRFVRAPGGDAGLSYLCSGHKAFYAHIAADLRAIARRIEQLRGPARP